MKTIKKEFNSNKFSLTITDFFKIAIKRTNLFLWFNFLIFIVFITLTLLSFIYLENKISDISLVESLKYSFIALTAISCSFIFYKIVMTWNLEKIMNAIEDNNYNKNNNDFYYIMIFTKKFFYNYTIKKVNVSLKIEDKVKNLEKNSIINAIFWFLSPGHGSKIKFGPNLIWLLLLGFLIMIPKLFDIFLSSVVPFKIKENPIVLENLEDFTRQCISSFSI